MTFITSLYSGKFWYMLVKRFLEGMADNAGIFGKLMLF